MSDLPAAAEDSGAVLNALSDAVVVIGADYRILQANTAARVAAGRRGHSGTDVVGQPCHVVLGCGCRPDSRHRECPAPAVLAHGQTMRATYVDVCENDANRRYVEIVASPMRDASGHVTSVIELRRDVTDEQSTKDTLIRRHEQLSILHAVAHTVNQSLDLADILGRALDEVLRLTGVDVGAIFLREEMIGGLELLAHRGLSEEAALAVAQFGMLDGSCGGAIEHTQVVIVPVLSRYRGRRAKTLQDEHLNTLVHVPLLARGNALGSMCVATRCTREFDASEQELLVAIGSQIAVAIENARLYAEVQRKEHLRGELLRKVITAQEEERKRIARELHDDTSQSLTAMLYAAEEAMAVGDLVEAKRVLGHVRGLAQHTLDGVHKLIFDLRPSVLDHLGLVPAIRWFAQSRLEPLQMRLVVEEGGLLSRLPAQVETVLFRVVQEAVTNIARHSMARNVHIAFSMANDVAAVSIADDGVGFDMVELSFAPDDGRGLGLMGMRERVQLLGGEMTIDSAPGQGTRLDIFVPMDETRGAEKS